MQTRWKWMLLAFDITILTGFGAYLVMRPA